MKLREMFHILKPKDKRIQAMLGNLVGDPEAQTLLTVLQAQEYDLLQPHLDRLTEANYVTEYDRNEPGNYHGIITQLHDMFKDYTGTPFVSGVDFPNYTG